MNCCAYKHENEFNQKSADQDLFNKQINQKNEEEVWLKFHILKP